MITKRTYSHNVLLALYPDSAVRERVEQLFRHSFPLTITVVLPNESSPEDELVGLIACGRLRAKGYRLLLACSAGSSHDRMAWAEEVRAFFWSLGETNIQITAEDSRDALQRRADIAIVDEDFDGEPNADLVLPLPLAPWAGEALDYSSAFLQNEIVDSWGQITRFDRDFPIRDMRTLPAAERRQLTEFHVSQLLAEIARRKRYRPEIPSRTIGLNDVNVRAAFESPDAIAALLRISAAADAGIQLDKLGEIVDDDIPRLLRALKLLLKADLVAMVADRCFLVPAQYTASNNHAQPTRRSVATSGSARARPHVPFYCYFPIGSFGYDLDDDEKCTAVRMIKAGLAEAVELPPPGSIVLDPTAQETLGEHDIPSLMDCGVCLIDTPWYRLPEISTEIEAQQPTCHFRRLELPRLTNAYYSATTKASTAAAAAYVAHFAGCVDQSMRILDLFEWGPEWKRALTDLG